MEYGGRWDLTMDFDVVSRDVYAQQEIADQTIVYIWGVLRPYLSSEGLEITDSLGGPGLSLVVNQTSGWQPFRMIRAAYKQQRRQNDLKIPV